MFAEAGGSPASRRGDRKCRIDAAALTGLGFLALLIASFVVGGAPPDAAHPTRETVAFWLEHRGAQTAAALLAGFAAVLLIWFGGVVMATLETSEGRPRRVASTAFAGFVLSAAGGLAVAGFQFAAARSAGDDPATVTQTLAVLNQDFFFLLDGGVLVAVFATAVATLRNGALPRWFGYASLAVGVVFLTPFFAVAFPAFGVWILLVALLTLRKSPACR
jgi:hypothetical protein